MRPPPIDRRPMPARRLPGDIVLTESEIRDLGLEKAPNDIGASWEEIANRQRRSLNHG